MQLPLARQDFFLFVFFAVASLVHACISVYSPLMSRKTLIVARFFFPLYFVAWLVMVYGAQASFHQSFDDP